MISPFEAMLTQAATNLGNQFVTAVLSDPEGAIASLKQLGESLDGLCAHSGYDACQDILDAVEHGHISHEAAMQAISVLMADMQRRRQRPAAPQPQPATADQAIAAWAGGELGLEAVADWLRTH